jgi:anti-repressor protein
MDEIVKIEENNGKQVVSARELHYFLEVGRDFTTWCKQMFEYGFEEDKDFTPISGKSTGGRPSVDYALSLDCAKGISMIQRTPKGKQARDYFIACEKKYRQIKMIDTPESIMAKALMFAKETLDRQEKQLALANTQIKSQAPKVEYYDAVLDSKKLTATNVIAMDLGISAINLNSRLKKDEVIYKVNGTYVLTAKYRGMGLAKTKTFPYVDSHGIQHTVEHLYWTEKGREFLLKKYLSA